MPFYLVHARLTVCCVLCLVPCSIYVELLLPLYGTSNEHFPYMDDIYDLYSVQIYFSVESLILNELRNYETRQLKRSHILISCSDNLANSEDLLSEMIYLQIQILTALLVQSRHVLE